MPASPYGRLAAVTRPSWAPSGVDIDKPSVARVYDYYLGGSHNFAADREFADKVIAAVPDALWVVQENRAFLRRAVRFLLSQGVDQFIDLGSGIPTVGDVHEVAAAINPSARTVYVDHDPVAVAHSRAILNGNANTVGACRRSERAGCRAVGSGRRRAPGHVASGRGTDDRGPALRPAR